MHAWTRCSRLIDWVSDAVFASFHMNWETFSFRGFAKATEAPEEFRHDLEGSPNELGTSLNEIGEPRNTKGTSLNTKGTSLNVKGEPGSAKGASLSHQGRPL